MQGYEKNAELYLDFRTIKISKKLTPKNYNKCTVYNMAQ
jgi:hypothetical protein